MKEDNLFGQFFKIKENNDRLFCDDDLQQKQQKSKSSRSKEGEIRVVYVDQMAAVLDKLDAELEPDLRDNINPITMGRKIQLDI